MTAALVFPLAAVVTNEFANNRRVLLASGVTTTLLIRLLVSDLLGL